jgi:hypothetical protein
MIQRPCYVLYLSGCFVLKTSEKNPPDSTSIDLNHLLNLQSSSHHTILVQALTAKTVNYKIEIYMSTTAKTA